MKLNLLALSVILSSINAFSQESNQTKEPLKLEHAEPLYIDLIRDLGAHKGEKEWNVGVGTFDNKTFDSHEFLVEYEWAAIDRLGFEVELPFTFYSPITGISNDSLPSNKLESLKLATQYTFLVSEKYHTSMAIGYMHEFEFSSFRDWGNPTVPGMVYNPFFVAAKKFANSLHTLLYTGPIITQHFNSNHWDFDYEFHANFHYMIPNTSNFVGVEVNNYANSEGIDCTVRPQMRVSLNEELMVGIVTGIPVERKEQGFSMFLRLIWEPPHK